MENEEFKTLKKNFFGQTERKRMLREKIKDCEERSANLTDSLETTNKNYKEAI